MNEEPRVTAEDLLAMCICSVITGGSLALNRSCPIHGAVVRREAPLDRLHVVERIRVVREMIEIRRGEITGANAFVHRESFKDIDITLEQLQNELRASSPAAHAERPDLLTECERMVIAWCEADRTCKLSGAFAVCARELESAMKRAALSERAKVEDVDGHR